jgi:hypothetical protein
VIAVEPKGPTVPVAVMMAHLNCVARDLRIRSGQALTDHEGGQSTKHRQDQGLSSNVALGPSQLGHDRALSPRILGPRLVRTSLLYLDVQLMFHRTSPLVIVRHAPRNIELIFSTRGAVDRLFRNRNPENLGRLTQAFSRSIGGDSGCWIASTTSCEMSLEELGRFSVPDAGTAAHLFPQRFRRLTTSASTDPHDRHAETSALRHLSQLSVFRAEPGRPRTTSPGCGCHGGSTSRTGSSTHSWVSSDQCQAKPSGAEQGQQNGPAL